MRSRYDERIRLANETEDESPGLIEATRQPGETGNKKVNEPTHLDLCSGTGAFSIAFEAEGFRTIGFSEIDPFCCWLLKHHWPNVPNYGDLRSIPTIPCDVLTAGDPCQPFSAAGRKLGEADDRYLWPSVLSAIERCGPDWCVLENVVGITGVVLARRINDLEDRGYQSKAFDIPSCGVGLPSLERHIWLIAARDEKRCERLHKNQHTDTPGRNQQATTDSRLEGKFQRPNLPASGLWRGTKGAARRVDRIHAIGNSIPPQVAQVIARTIHEQIRNEHATG